MMRTHSHTLARGLLVAILQNWNTMLSSFLTLAFLFAETSKSH